MKRRPNELSARIPSVERGCLSVSSFLQTGELDLLPLGVSANVVAGQSVTLSPQALSF